MEIKHVTIKCPVFIFDDWKSILGSTMKELDFGEYIFDGYCWFTYRHSEHLFAIVNINTEVSSLNLTFYSQFPEPKIKEIYTKFISIFIYLKNQIEQSSEYELKLTIT